MRNFREYDVWIDSMNLVDTIYGLVDKFPKNEQYVLSSQMPRSAISIPSNISEGASRKSEKDFARFLEIGLGSAFELETQVRIAHRRNYISEENKSSSIDALISLQKRISALRFKVLGNKNKS
jgi:four helix bundle protein